MLFFSPSYFPTLYNIYSLHLSSLHTFFAHAPRELNLHIPNGLRTVLGKGSRGMNTINGPILGLLKIYESEGRQCINTVWSAAECRGGGMAFWRFGVVSLFASPEDGSALARYAAQRNAVVPWWRGGVLAVWCCVAFCESEGRQCISTVWSAAECRGGGVAFWCCVAFCESEGRQCISTVWSAAECRDSVGMIPMI